MKEKQVDMSYGLRKIIHILLLIIVVVRLFGRITFKNLVFAILNIEISNFTLKSYFRNMCFQNKIKKKKLFSKIIFLLNKIIYLFPKNLTLLKPILQNKIIYLFPKDSMLLKLNLQMTDLQRLHHPLEELKRATGFLCVYNWRNKVTSS